jgi:hypothetical protein
MEVIRSELRGKNKVYICLCKCGKEKVFWKKSAIDRQKSCGCLIDDAGLSGKQRRSMLSRMQGYKNGAKKRNFVWQLTYSQFVEIATKNCFYCGSDPKVWDCMTNSPSLKKDSPNVNPDDYKIKFTGIDRFDSKKGYTLDNVVPCCVFCNRSKNDLSFDVFKEKIEKTYKWLYQKK